METESTRKEKILVNIESPFSGNRLKNVAYARACMRHSLALNEAPIASHLLYTQMLDDTIPSQRKLGIEAGFSWNQHASKTIVYTDLGYSSGMRWGISDAEENGRPVVYRQLDSWKWTPVISEIKMLATLIKEVFIEFVVKSKFR